MLLRTQKIRMESAEQGRTSLVLVRHKFGSSLEGVGCMSEGLDLEERSYKDSEK